MGLLLSSMRSSSPPTTFRMPDLEKLFSVFPDEGTSPHYHDELPGARAWILHYQNHVYGPKMASFMDRCKAELLVSHAFPYATQLRLRSMMDLYNLFWLYDEYTDVQTGDQAKQTAQLVRRAFNDLSFNDGSWLCAILQDFRRRNLDPLMSPAFTKRFIEHFCLYTDQVGDEAVYREKRQVLDIQEYMIFRREAAAVRAVLDSIEHASEIELDPTVLEDPTFQMAYNAALDLLLCSNDIHSYNMEQAKGHEAANIITVIMKARGRDVQGAMDYCGGYCEALVAQFLDARRTIEGRANKTKWKDALDILNGYGIFLLGQIRWNFESERYFGGKVQEIRKTLTVELRAPFADHVNLAD